jgi:hypothetical protein
MIENELARIATALEKLAVLFQPQEVSGAVDTAGPDKEPDKPKRGRKKKAAAKANDEPAMDPLPPWAMNPPSRADVREALAKVIKADPRRAKAALEAVGAETLTGVRDDQLGALMEQLDD